MARCILARVSQRLKDLSEFSRNGQPELSMRSSGSGDANLMNKQFKAINDNMKAMHAIFTDFYDLYLIFQRHIEDHLKVNDEPLASASSTTLLSAVGLEEEQEGADNNATAKGQIVGDIFGEEAGDAGVVRHSGDLFNIVGRKSDLEIAEATVNAVSGNDLFQSSGASGPAPRDSEDEHSETFYSPSGSVSTLDDSFDQEQQQQKMIMPDPPPSRFAQIAHRMDTNVLGGELHSSNYEVICSVSEPNEEAAVAASKNTIIIPQNPLPDDVGVLEVQVYETFPSEQGTEISSAIRIVEDERIAPEATSSSEIAEIQADDITWPEMHPSGGPLTADDVICSAMRDPLEEERIISSSEIVEEEEENTMSAMPPSGASMEDEHVICSCDLQDAIVTIATKESLADNLHEILRAMEAKKPKRTRKRKNIAADDADPVAVVEEEKEVPVKVPKKRSRIRKVPHVAKLDLDPVFPAVHLPVPAASPSSALKISSAEETSSHGMSLRRRKPSNASRVFAMQSPTTSSSVTNGLISGGGGGVVVVKKEVDNDFNPIGSSDQSVDFDQSSCRSSPKRPIRSTVSFENKSPKRLTIDFDDDDVSAYQLFDELNPLSDEICADVLPSDDGGDDDEVIELSEDDYCPSSGSDDDAEHCAIWEHRYSKHVCKHYHPHMTIVDAVALKYQRRLTCSRLVPFQRSPATRMRPSCLPARSELSTYELRRRSKFITISLVEAEVTTCAHSEHAVIRSDDRNESSAQQRRHDDSEQSQRRRPPASYSKRKHVKQMNELDEILAELSKHAINSSPSESDTTPPASSELNKSPMTAAAQTTSSDLSKSVPAAAPPPLPPPPSPPKRLPKQTLEQMIAKELSHTSMSSPAPRMPKQTPAMSKSTKSSLVAPSRMLLEQMAVNEYNKSLVAPRVTMAQTVASKTRKSPISSPQIQTAEKMPVSVASKSPVEPRMTTTQTVASKTRKLPISSPQIQTTAQRATAAATELAKASKFVEAPRVTAQTTSANELTKSPVAAAPRVTTTQTVSSNPKQSPMSPPPQVQAPAQRVARELNKAAVSPSKITVQQMSASGLTKSPAAAPLVTTTQAVASGTRKTPPTSLPQLQTTTQSDAASEENEASKSTVSLSRMTAQQQPQGSTSGSTKSPVAPRMRTLCLRLYNVDSMHNLWTIMRDFVRNKKAVLLKISVERLARQQLMVLCKVCNLNFKVSKRQVIVVKHKTLPPLTVAHLQKAVKECERGLFLKPRRIHFDKK